MFLLFSKYKVKGEFFMSLHAVFEGIKLSRKHDRLYVVTEEEDYIYIHNAHRKIRKNRR